MLIKSIYIALRRGSAVAAVLTVLTASVARSQRVTAAPVVQSTDLATMDLEQLMKIEVVVAGAKRAQPTRDVPSFVSVVTAADIQEHGYRTLGDVLKSLPSFYVSNDRNYAYIGVRGFDRPGDYSSRVLLLLNGVRTNDNVYDQAYIGEEFAVDVDLIDRIEVIRGPGAALYGSNAFFAVINVVTKQGRQLQGGEVAATSASFGTYAGRASYGRKFANALDVLVSASASDSKGQRLYYPEFDSPSTNNGIANDDDAERFHKLLATASMGHFSFQAVSSSREKGVPTAAFGTRFNDNRTKTVDGLSLASLSYSQSFADGTSISTHAFSGRWSYGAAYAFEPGVAPNRDDDVGAWWGLDFDARRAISRHLITVGAELQDNYKQDQRNYDPDPYFSYADIHDKSVRWGMFAQDEIKLFAPLVLSAGLRLDDYQTFGTAMSPRVGLIYTPDSETTVKVLAGHAFRAPNAYELYYDSDLYKANPLLEPEQIETLELIAQRFVGRGTRISASAFRNRLSQLISQHVDSTDHDRLVFANADRIESKGMELGLAVNRGHGMTGEVTYTLQRTADRATGLELTNSPRQMTKLLLRTPLGFVGMIAGVDAQYMSSRRTLTETTNPGYMLTSLSLLAPRTFGRVEASATIYNVFGVRYADPASDEHVQAVIQQDGRSFRVKATVRY